eukprot:scaffold699_cov231-Pinguiococcus_pyrenoidosus.AAC.9
MPAVGARKAFPASIPCAPSSVAQWVFKKQCTHTLLHEDVHVRHSVPESAELRPERERVQVRGTASKSHGKGHDLLLVQPAGDSGEPMGSARRRRPSSDSRVHLAPVGMS